MEERKKDYSCECFQLRELSWLPRFGSAPGGGIDGNRPFLHPLSGSVLESYSTDQQAEEFYEFSREIVLLLEDSLWNEKTPAGIKKWVFCWINFGGICCLPQHGNVAWYFLKKQVRGWRTKWSPKDILHSVCSEPGVCRISLCDFWPWQNEIKSYPHYPSAFDNNIKTYKTIRTIINEICDLAWAKSGPLYWKSITKNL